MCEVSPHCSVLKELLRLVIGADGTFRTRREYWDVVDIQSHIPEFQLPKKAIELNGFRRFEYEYEYRDAEYEKTELLAAKIPEEPFLLPVF